MLRNSALAPHAVTLMLFVSACGDSTVSGGGDDGEQDDVPSVPDHDAELRCPATGELALQTLGQVVGGAVIGPCGHVAYHDDQGQGWLVAPDASQVELDHEQLAFAPTGDLLAWSPALDGGLRLRELLSGSERELIASGNVDDFGFVPSFADPDRSAWLWTCEQGLLERHDLDASEPVAESVVCGSVVGSSGSPRIVYADQDGRVWMADLDADVQIATEDAEFVGYDGSKRDDTLWIDHDGELLTHVAIEWQGDDDSDSEWQVELWARVFDRHGEAVLDSPDDGLAWRQAPRRGAPVFVFDDGQALRFDAGVPSSVASALSRTQLAESGELFFSNESDELLIAERTTAPLTSVGQLHTPVEIRPSRSGTVAAIEHHSDTCVVDAQGECDRIVLALRRWTRDAGLDELVLYSTTPWELLATLDDGRMLVIGAPVEIDGPTYSGEQPEPRVLLLSDEGEIEAEWPASNGGLSVRQVFVLGPDRVLFEYRDQLGGGSLVVAGGQFDQVGLGNADVLLLQAWVDARGQRVAFVSEHADGAALNYGSVPLL
ncbi:MAG TPA: hypothetical protein VM869_36650 [Enhygromyxa sp.]|nr:hypothetical protein [Enhygromyxa sp.]